MHALPALLNPGMTLKSGNLLINCNGEILLKQEHILVTKMLPTEGEESSRGQCAPLTIIHHAAGIQ